MGSGDVHYRDDGSISGGSETGGMFQGSNIDNLIVRDNFTFENVRTAKLLFRDANIKNHNIDFATANNLTSIEGAFYRAKLGGLVDLSGWDINGIDDEGLRTVLYDTKVNCVKVIDSAAKSKLEGTKGVPSGLTLTVE